MSTTIQASITIAAPAITVFKALTDPNEVTAWFAEHARIAPDAGVFAFWGRHTPGTVKSRSGGQRLLALEPDRALSFDWTLGDAETTVAIELAQEDGATLVTVTHENVPPAPHHGSTLEDFWSLALLNLQAWSERGAIGARPDYAAVDNGTVRAEVEIDAPRSAVYATLIEPEQLERYIATTATVEPWVSGRYDFGWGEGPIKVLELVTDEQLTYSWVHSDEPETVVTWELAESGGRTRLTLVHSGFAPDDERPDYRIGWLEFLVRIKRMVEVGGNWQRPQIKAIERAAA
jgi:uncharacterized protein YndB with AHSA1/START domain